MTLKRDPVHFCWKCGYALRGLPGNRCPECGRLPKPELWSEQEAFVYVFLILCGAVFLFAFVAFLFAP